MGSTEQTGGVDALLGAFSVLYRFVMTGYRRDRYPFTKTQLLILFALLYRDSLTMKEVTEYIGSSKEQATRAVAPLVEGGYVERFPDPHNRTHIHIRFTELGREAARQIQADRRQAILDRLERTVGPEDQARLNTAAQELTAMLERLI